jgi:ribosomal protein L12E/L44/L45/RPP1/RPP2
MDDVVDMIANGASASEVSDRLKDILMQKSAANIDEVRPKVAASMFGATQAEVEADAEEEEKPEASAETETEEEPTPEEETD